MVSELRMMAEMLIRTVDKERSDDPYIDAKRSKRGDVIAVCADGHPWTAAELNAPYWTIVKVPGVPVEKLSAYTVPEIGDSKLDRMLQRRAFRCDLEGLVTKSLSEVEAQARKKPSPKLADPNVMGEPEDVM